MKYIRTKDEIFELCDENSDYFITNEYIISKLDVIAKADNIEKLCDEFVYVSHKKPVIGYSMKCDYSNTVVYGAIWTERGLIYVAKMNDKRELELL